MKFTKRFSFLCIVATILLSMISCTNTDTPESEEQQVKRLLKISDEREKLRLEQERLEKERMAKEEQARLEKQMEKVEAIKRGEIDKEIIVDESFIENQEEQKNNVWIDPHIGKTRGEIMVYEMEKVSKELEVLESDFKNQQENREKLLKYKEKLEELDRKNKAGLNK